MTLINDSGKYFNSKVVSEKLPTYPKAIATPGIAKGNIATASSRLPNGRFFRVNKYDITSPTVKAMMVLNIL